MTLDSAGQERYYLIQYKVNQKKYGTIKRTAHSLVVVYKMTEQREDEQKYFLYCVEEKDLEDHKHDQKKKKTIVKVPKDIQMMSDTH